VVHLERWPEVTAYSRSQKQPLQCTFDRHEVGEVFKETTVTNVGTQPTKPEILRGEALKLFRKQRAVQ